jgi:peptide/nickel transport system substrate-binding protein
MGLSRDILTFDPFNMSTGVMWHNIYDTLTRYDAAGKLQPRLAERWDFEDGGRRMIVRLRPGVRFHSGRPFVADDVVFSVKRAQDPAVAANIRPLALTVRSIEAQAQRTVVLGFDRPNAGIFDLFDLLFIHDKDTVSTLRNRGNGTGPFKFVEWNPGSNVRLARNEHYWRPGVPYLQELVLHVAPDIRGMVIQLRAGAVDMVEFPLPVEVKRMRTQPGYKVVDAPIGDATWGVALNVTRKPLDNPKVREAIKLAIDRQRFVEIQLAGQGEPWCLPWPKHSLAYVSELANSCRYDPDRARQLLREAGFPNGFETSIMSSGVDLIAPLLQADLEKVGIKARIDSFEEAVGRPKRVSGDFDIGAGFWLRANKDPSSLLGTTIFWNPISGNSQFRDPEYTRLVAEGASTLDPGRRREIYRRITEIIVQQNFMLPVAPASRSWIMRDRVRGMDMSLDGFEIFERVWLAP